MIIDARGYTCPIPLLKLKKALQINNLVELWTDDPASEIDIRNFCNITNNELVGFIEEVGRYQFKVKKI